MRAILPLGVEHGVFLLMKVGMLVVRESKGASAMKGGNEDRSMHLDVVESTCQEDEVGVVRSWMRLSCRTSEEVGEK